MEFVVHIQSSNQNKRTILAEFSFFPQKSHFSNKSFGTEKKDFVIDDSYQTECQDRINNSQISLDPVL